MKEKQKKTPFDMSKPFRRTGPQITHNEKASATIRHEKYRNIYWNGDKENPIFLVTVLYERCRYFRTLKEILEQGLHIQVRAESNQMKAQR
jgi:hypothetical protein